MKTHRILVLAVLVLGFSLTAHAQATRTWISGVGDDVNPCSRTAPCKTWAGAISKTAVGGEIDALDSGGFGAVTITKPITLNGYGVIASTLHSGVNGIVISITTSFPGFFNNVWIRNVDITGGGTGINGIRILQAASVSVEHCNIYDDNNAGTGVGTSHGIDVANTGALRLNVTDTSIRDINGAGIFVLPNSASPVSLTLDNVRISNMTGPGVQLGNTSGSPVDATIARSTFTQNGGAGLYNRGANPVNVYSSVLSLNGYGVHNGDQGAGVVRLYGTQIVDNSIDGIFIASGTVATHSNNAIFGNAGTQATNSTINQQ